jgi:uncharacterized protein (DUF2141 family)
MAIFSVQNNVKFNSITMKKTIVLGINLLMGLLFICLASYIQNQHETEVKVTGIRSNKGKIVLNVFKDNASYDDGKPYKKFVFDKKAIVNGTLVVSCKLDPGIYGFTMVDDENDNGKIDKNFIGMPKEGFGFSNFFMEKMKKPAFDDFKVDLNTHSKIEIRVKYM